MNRSESKYFSTAVRMDNAFLELIEEKEFAYITVKEIFEKAGVNRSTFYLHYETIGELLEESTQYILDQFVACMPQNTSDFLGKLRDRPLDELYLITPDYLMPYLSYIKEHRGIFRTTIAYASTLKMDTAYEKLNRYVFSLILDRYGVPAEDQNYIIRFHIAGIMAIITEWIKADCEDTIEHIISVIMMCVKRR